LSVENWGPLKPVLGGVRDVALIHYPSCTDSINPSLQFLCNFVVINASEGSLCFQIFNAMFIFNANYVTSKYIARPCNTIFYGVAKAVLVCDELYQGEYCIYSRLVFSSYPYFRGIPYKQFRAPPRLHAPASNFAFVFVLYFRVLERK
jgi:hypothetical protein